MNWLRSFLGQLAGLLHGFNPRGAGASAVAQRGGGDDAAASQILAAYLAGQGAAARQAPPQPPPPPRAPQQPPQQQQDPNQSAFNSIVSQVPVVGAGAAKVAQGVEAVAHALGLGVAQQLDPWDPNSGVFVGGLDAWPGILAYSGGPTVTIFDKTVPITTAEQKAWVLDMQAQRKAAIAAHFQKPQPPLVERDASPAPAPGGGSSAGFPRPKTGVWEN